MLRAFISRTENAIYRTENAIYCTENPQSREEQRTEEQRTVEDSRAEQTREEKAVTADSGLTTELEEKLNCKFDHNFCLELRRLQNKGMQREVFLDTARQTAENAPRNPAGYFRTLLQNCERDGILTAEDMQKRAKPAPAQPAIERTAVRVRSGMVRAGQAVHKGKGGAVITLFNRARVCYNETDKRGD